MLHINIGSTLAVYVHTTYVHMWNKISTHTALHYSGTIDWPDMYVNMDRVKEALRSSGKQSTPTPIYTVTHDTAS